MRIAGIDDAGRGSIIGPLVIAGVLYEETELPKLRTLGVKDSKLLSPSKREALIEDIKVNALNWHVIQLTPLEVDNMVKNHKLNRLEAHTMATVINVLKPDVAFIDASDVSIERFKNHVTEDVHIPVTIISEHKADIKYPIVSAASIIAKVERDRTLSILQETYGNLGSGYPSDTTTQAFLESWVKKHGTFPDFVRKTWAPVKRLKKKFSTK